MTRLLNPPYELQLAIAKPAKGFRERWKQGWRKTWQRADWESFAGADWTATILDAEVTDDFHAKQGRSTGRWILTRGDKKLHVYLKRHYRLAWWRGLLAALLPGRDWSPAFQEMRQLRWAATHGVPAPKVVAAGEFIGPRGRLQSVLAIEELAGMLPLHEAIPLAARQLEPRAFRRWKTGLIEELARLTRFLHDRRCFHKDLYLCHFFIARSDIDSPPRRLGNEIVGQAFQPDAFSPNLMSRGELRQPGKADLQISSKVPQPLSPEEQGRLNGSPPQPQPLTTEEREQTGSWRGRVFLIDFHRFGRHRWTWPVWQVKDLGQLLYSSFIDGINDRDRLRFWRYYLAGASGSRASGSRASGFRAHGSRPRRPRFLTWCVRFKGRRYSRHNAKKEMTT